MLQSRLRLSAFFPDYLPIFFASLHVEEKIRATAQAVKIRGGAIFFGHTHACTILLASLALNVAVTKVIYPHRTVFPREGGIPAVIKKSSRNSGKTRRFPQPNGVIHSPSSRLPSRYSPRGGPTAVTQSVTYFTGTQKKTGRVIVAQFQP